MKITIFKACLVGILAAFSITAYAGPVTGDYTKIVNTYIDSYMNDNYKNMDKIMSDYSTLTIPRADNIIVESKSDVVDEMKSEGRLKQNCQASYEVIAKSTAVIIVRVDFNYENCDQQNFLTLEKNEDKEWQITQVCKIFNDKEPGMSTEKVVAKN